MRNTTDAFLLMMVASPVAARVEDVVSVDHAKESRPVVLCVQFVSDLLKMDLPQIVRFTLSFRHRDAGSVQRQSKTLK